MIGAGLGAIGDLGSFGVAGGIAEGSVETGLGIPVPGAGVSFGALLLGIGEGVFGAFAAGEGTATLSARWRVGPGAISLGVALCSETGPGACSATLTSFEGLLTGGVTVEG